MSFYEDLVLQTQMVYSGYRDVYASGKTPVRLSQRKPLPYNEQIDLAAPCRSIWRPTGILSGRIQGGNILRHFWRGIMAKSWSCSNSA